MTDDNGSTPPRQRSLRLSPAITRAAAALASFALLDTEIAAMSDALERDGDDRFREAERVRQLVRIPASRLQALANLLEEFP